MDLSLFFTVVVSRCALFSFANHVIGQPHPRNAHLSGLWNRILIVTSVMSILATELFVEYHS